MRSEIIAELGINWLGSMELAEAMIAEAAQCGCDYIKTQTWQSKKIRKGPWESEIGYYKQCQLDTPEKHMGMLDLCAKYKIKYLTTLFDCADYSCLPPMKEIKIAGIEASNLPLLELCATKFEKVYLSTCGLSNKEISSVVRFFDRYKAALVIMHGIYMYPCPIQQSLMGKIKLLRTFHKHIGYSDHTEGPYAAYFALSHEVDVVERHFTISNCLPGIDNRFSCLPDEMKKVCAYRDACSLMLSGIQPDESFILDNFKGRWHGGN